MTREKLIKLQRKCIGAAHLAVDMWDVGQVSPGYVDGKLKEMRESLEIVPDDIETES